MASLLTLLAMDSLSFFPAVLLAIKLNVFAVPLAVAGVLSFDLWVWYVVALLWASQLLYYLEIDVATAASSVRSASSRLPELASVPISTEPIVRDDREPK